MLSSTSFSPTLFLSQVHDSASTEQLLRGLDALTQSIEKKSASLKVLVESNFERFVRAKATIDNVYAEMRDRGAESDNMARPHTRHSSRPSNSRNQLSPGLLAAGGDRRKHALIKESEYGTLGVKFPLTEASAKAEKIWGPALGGREREEQLKSVLSSIEQNKNIFDTGAALEQAVMRRDYEALADEYTKVQRYAKGAKVIADRAKQNDLRLSDAQMHQIIITARVWIDVQICVEDFKRDTWRRLHNANFTPKADDLESKSEEYMDLINVLLQLGVEENPIWIWLLSRYDFLQNKISTNFERVRIELEVQRRRLASTGRPTMRELASKIRSVAEPRKASDASNFDMERVYQFWEKEQQSLGALLLARGGLLGDIIEYWELTQSFTEGVKQRGLSVGIDGSSRKHHKLSREQVVELQGGAADLFGMVREQAHSLFVEPPIEDISSLFTPIPQTPKTPMSATLLTPTKNSKFTFDPNDLPSTPSQTGEAWEKFAFWPPHGNSLSGAHYLSKINNLVATAASDMASVAVVKQDPRLLQQLRSLVGDVRERSISAICGAWLVDSENCRELEDWTRSVEKPDLTNMPSGFNAFEMSLLTNLQKIMYLPEAANSAGSANVVTQPPSRHIETIQRAFKHSLYKAFSGMMEHAAKSPSENNSDGTNSIAVPLMKDRTLRAQGEAIDASNASVRKLLTIANFQSLRNDIIPTLIGTFETSFTHTITDDAKTARDVLSQMNARVFQAYVRPTVEYLRDTISKGVSDPNYGKLQNRPNLSSKPSNTAQSDLPRPSDARPYVYDVLLKLVLVHNEAHATSPPLTAQLLSYLLESVSASLLASFKDVKHFTLTALMQATLDVEFLSQTLDNYTTGKASETQSQIYLCLDERTDNDARQKLQMGLPEMRRILKGLREGSRGVFGCFRRERGRGERERRKREESNAGSAA